MVAVHEQQRAAVFVAGEREAMRQIAREEIAAALANYTPGGLKAAIFGFDSGDSSTALTVPVNAADSFEVPFHCAAQTWFVTCLDNNSAMIGSASLDVFYAAPGVGIEAATSLVGAGTDPFVTSDYENTGRCVGDWDTVDLEPGGRVFAVLNSVSLAKKVCLTVRLRAKTEGSVA